MVSFLELLCPESGAEFAQGKVLEQFQELQSGGIVVHGGWTSSIWCMSAYCSMLCNDPAYAASISRPASEESGDLPPIHISKMVKDTLFACLLAGWLAGWLAAVAACVFGGC